METAHLAARGGRFAFDTTLVLFFLALDFGESVRSLSLDSALSACTLGMLVILPYFLPAVDERPAFAEWLLGRLIITVFAMGLGLVFAQTIGTILPDSLRFLPMTLLIVAAMFSCYVQFFGMLRVRLAK